MVDFSSTAAIEICGLFARATDAFLRRAADRGPKAADLPQLMADLVAVGVSLADDLASTTAISQLKADELSRAFLGAIIDAYLGGLRAGDPPEALAGALNQLISEHTLLTLETAAPDAGRA